MPTQFNFLVEREKLIRLKLGKTYQPAAEVKEPQSDSGTYTNNGSGEDDLPF